MYDMYDFYRAAQNADDSMMEGQPAADGSACERPVRSAFRPARRAAATRTDRGHAVHAVQMALDRRDNGGVWSTLSEA